MKFLFLFVLITFFGSSLKAQNLKCSAKGTQIFHIPGAFTSDSDQDKAIFRINNLLELKPKYFDLKSQNVKPIKIASQGLLMDKLNYIMLSLPPGPARDVSWLLLGSAEFGFNIKNDLIAVAKSGGVASVVNKGGAIVTKLRGTVKNGKFVAQTVTRGEVESLFKLTSTSLSVSTENLNSIKEILEPIAGQDDKNFTTRGGKVLSLIDVSSPINLGKSIYNIASIALLEEKFNIDVIDQQRDTLLGSYFTTDKNIKNIVNAITNKLKDNKKVIINAHGEGNQLAESAIAEIKNLGSDEQKTKLSKFVSILATSPTTDKYLDKYFYIKHDFDLRDFGGSDVGYNYVISKNNPLVTTINENREINQFYSFLNFYIGSLVKGAKNVQGATVQTMRENFASELRLAAESLEDNCLTPVIKVSSSQFMSEAIDNKYVTTGFAGQIVKLKVEDIGGDPDKNGVDDEGYDRSKTIFTYKVETHYPAKTGFPASVDVTEDELVGSGQFISIPTPYQDLDYRVTIKAVQPSSGREGTYSLSFKVGQNKPLTAAVYSQSCYADSQGYNPYGSLEYKIIISDDEYIYNGKVTSHITNSRQVSYTVYDSANSFSDVFSNSCSISKPLNHWKILVVCQKGDLNVCYGSCPAGLDHSIVNTGLQWTYANIYDDRDILMFQTFLGEVNNGNGSVYKTFADPNDSNKRISVDVGSSCPRGGDGPQRFEL